MVFEDSITFCPAFLSSLWELMTEEQRLWFLSTLDIKEKLTQSEEKLAQSEEKVRRLTGELEKLRQKEAEQTARLNQDSTNSHKPPSSDNPAKDKKKQRRTKRKGGQRSPGGQKGHKGNRRNLPMEEVTSLHNLIPGACCACMRSLSQEDSVGKPRPHQVFELPKIEMEVIHYNLHRCRCPDCGEYTQAQPPQEHRSGQGPNLTAFIGLCTAAFRLPRRLLQGLLKAMTGRSISLGAIQACWERCGKAVSPSVRRLETLLPSLSYVNIDETGWKEKGKRRWLWVAASNLFSCLSVHSRGRAQLHSWFPNGFSGVVSSDRWHIYDFFPKRQLCWSHLIRDLKGIVEAQGKGAVRAGQEVRHCYELFSLWHQYKDGLLSRTELQDKVKPLRFSLKRFCRNGKNQTFKATEKDHKWRRLGTSLLKYWCHVYRFIDEDGVEATNNHAEQQIRHGVLWRKISQGSRSAIGSKAVADMLSVLQTCRKQKRSTLAFLREALIADWKGRPCPNLILDSS